MEIRLVSEQSVKAQLVELLSQFGELNYRNDDVYFKEDGLLDSIKMLRFFMMVQKHFDIKFSPSDIKDNDIYRLSALTTYIYKLVA